MNRKTYQIKDIDLASLSSYMGANFEGVSKDQYSNDIFFEFTESEEGQIDTIKKLYWSRRAIELIPQDLFGIKKNLISLMKREIRNK